MRTRARGRGVAATFGLLLVLAGVAGAAVLWIMAERRPEQAIERFARGPVGCTTTLEFSDTGTFFVYEERLTEDADAFAACEPVPAPDAEFSVDLLDGDTPLTLRNDTSVSYDTSTAVGRSIGRIEIDRAGQYDLTVVGADPAVVAAVGREPDAGVDELRRGAIIVGVLGVLLGSLLLVLAGRRSKRAATYGPPDGPGWGPQHGTSTGAAATWPPEPPRVSQQPINPMLPPEPVVAASPTATEADPAVSSPEPSAAGEPPATEPAPDVAEPSATDRDAPSVWAPPQPGERRDPPPPT